ncbi:hypothetical protein [Anaerobaca lacustris]|uniref:Glycine zipper family protein n=1 Tax=Anaerobaca lacustris TaxID=3044600 RepID=A0AAW6TRR7_9BACT|nr:hypothetical protein [Sedimentisphaerales bacterium M17dextr]
MKRFAMIAVVCGVCGLAGCGTNTTDRLAVYDQAVARLEATSAAIDERLASIDAFLGQAKTALADPNLGDAATEILTGIEAALARRDDAIEAKGRVDAALAQIRAQIEALKASGSLDVADEISLIGSGLAAAGQSAGGKTGAWLGLVGGLIAGAAGVLKGSRSAADARHVTERIISSIDTLLASPIVTDVAGAKKILQKDQGTAIAATVNRIKEG